MLCAGDLSVQSASNRHSDSVIFSQCPSRIETTKLCDQLDDTTSLSDLLLGELADPAGTDDEGNFGETALSENLGVAEGEEVDDGDGVLLLALDVGLADLGGDERPELWEQERLGLSHTRDWRL